MRTELDDYIATRADVRAYLDRALSDAETHSQQEATLFEMVKDKLLQSGARLVAHYYVDSEIQRLAEETPTFFRVLGIALVVVSLTGLLKSLVFG